MTYDYDIGGLDAQCHSGHLGSVAYLTSGGHVTQTLNYLPYYGIGLGYNCSYDAVGERIDKESMSHSGCIGPIQFGTNGDVLVGVNVLV